tara:strand:+ start:2522 stop:2881 length:360 start_codon:yes stop_codon:yes gene_type:complete
MAHYEMYVCLKKATYESQIPTELQSNLGWNNYTYDDDGNVTSTTAYRPTWKEAAFKGKLGAPRVSPGGSYIVVKGEFSMKEGELSAIASLGASMAYPNNSVLTKTEAQALVASDTWNNG